MTGKPPLVRLDRVTKDYAGNGRNVRALDSVSLDVAEGRFVAIMGRSGCGKTTLLNLAGAIDFPTSGRVLLDGIETSSLDDGGITRVRREKVGFVFQSFQLIHTLSAVENVELPLLLAGVHRPRAAALERLEWVGLAGLADRMPHQMSGGEMQRVAIARALVRSPRLILADEPTGNLDTATGSEVLALLRRIASEQGVSVLMATHSREAADMSDIVIRLRDGRIEQDR